MAIVLDGTTIKEMFPSTKTKTINKLITENSLTRLLNRLLDVDSYIITSEFPDTINIEDEYDYISVNNELLDTDLEVCIRGYYFNLGPYTKILSKITEDASVSNNSLKKDDVIKAIIYIDDSIKEYPELYGQESTEGIRQAAEQEDNKSVFYFDESCNKNNVSNIKIFKDYDDVTPVTKLQVSDIVTPNKGRRLVTIINEEETDISVEFNIVKYVKTSTIPSIALYKNDDKPDKPSDTIPLKEYELVLFKMKDSETFTIPLSSIHRFSSLASSSIDGGLIQNKTI